MSDESREIDKGDLKQNLSEKLVWAITYGSCIGWGAFILPSDRTKQLGPIASAIGIVIGALLMILIAVSYGVLVERFPASGGASASSYLNFGRYVSFFSLRFLTFGYVCVVALDATISSLLIKSLLLNILNSGGLYTTAGRDVYIAEVVIAAVLLLVFMFIAIRGANVPGTFQYYFHVAMVIVVVLMFIGLFFGNNFPLSNLQPLASKELGWFSSIIVIVAITPWAYVGLDNIPQTAEELNLSPNKTFKLTVYSLLAAALTHVIVILYTGWLGTNNMNFNGNLWLTGAETQTALGYIGLGVLATITIMGIFTGLNGFLVSSSRLLFSMGRAGVMPKASNKLHPKYKTFYVAIISLVAITLIAPWLGRTALTRIVDVFSTGVSIAYFITCLSAAKLFSYNKQSNTYGPLYKTFAILGSIVSLIFLLLLLVPESPTSFSMPSYITLGGWSVIGLIFFVVRHPKLKDMNNDELSRLISNQSKRGVKEMIKDKK